MPVYSFPTLPRTSRLVLSFNCASGSALASARVRLCATALPLVGTHWVEGGLGTGFGALVPPSKSLCPHVALP